MPQKFIVIDGHSVIYRAYYAPGMDLSISCFECDRQTPDCSHCLGTGREPTKATYIVTKQLIKLCRERDPAYIAFTCDGPRDQLFRRKLYPGYKADRPDAPKEVLPQVTRIHQIVDLFGICRLKVQGYEADDIIATLATQCVSDDVHVSMISRDNDLEQLLSDRRITMYDPLKEEYIDYDWVVKRRNCIPELLTVMKSLSGESGDNIVGVKGIGPVNAAKLATEYKSIEKVIEAASELKPKMGQAIREAADRIRLNMKLVELDRNVPLTITADDLAYKGLNLNAAKPFFRHLGFSTLTDI